MIIHVVQPNETIVAIAYKYNLPVVRVIEDNGLTDPDNLVVGQTIVIVYPLETYIVQEGDTLQSIALSQDVSILELLRNNPDLSDRDYIFPGETLIIRYKGENKMKVATSGYAYPFINKDTLRKTLPFLTYLTVFNYQVTKEGDLIEVDDAEIIELAKSYGTAPMMLISTLSTEGRGSREAAYSILNNPEIQDKLINNIISMLKQKGYYGLNVYLQFLIEENRLLVEAYIKKLSERLRMEGFRLVITITPRPIIERTEVYLQEVDYTTIGKLVDGLLILSYDWGYSYGPPASVTPVNLARVVLDYATQLVPPEKILGGLPVIGYDWPLPYIYGVTRANSISSENAIRIAASAGVSIQFDEISQAPYFFYESDNQKLRIVWFKDARSIDVITSLIPDYKLQGFAVWNIMNYFHQLWLITNVKFDIEKVL